MPTDDSLTVPVEPLARTAVSVNGSVDTKFAARGHIPRLVIRPKAGWQALDLRELWRYRELLYFLTWRDIKVRYRQTLLGAAWAIIQPLFAMIIFTLLFGKVAKLDKEIGDIPYSVFSFAALLPWTYFANALSSASNSLVGNANLLTKVYFPRLIIPGSAVVSGLVDYGIAFVVLIVLMLFNGVWPSFQIFLLLPFLTFLTTVLALGVSLWLSALNVRFRDVRYMVPFMVQLWMYATPIVYPMHLVPEKYRWIVALNPMAGVIEGYRSAIFGTPWDLGSLAFSIVFAASSLMFGAFYFRRLERTFADIV